MNSASMRRVSECELSIYCCDYANSVRAVGDVISGLHASGITHKLTRVESSRDECLCNCVMFISFSCKSRQVNLKKYSNPQLIFSGEYTKAMSKDWHSGHFNW